MDSGLKWRLEEHSGKKNKISNSYSQKSVKRFGDALTPVTIGSTKREEQNVLTYTSSSL